MTRATRIYPARRTSPRPPLNLRIDPRRQRVADIRHRQPHFRAVDQSGPPEPVLDRRRARLGEQKPRQVDQRPPIGQRTCVIAAQHRLADRDKRLRLDMRGRQNAAVGALRQRVVKQRILPGQHREAIRPVPQQIERLRRIRRAILHADDVWKLRKPQHLLVAEIDAGSIRDVVDHDRLCRAVGQR